MTAFGNQDKKDMGSDSEENSIIIKITVRMRKEMITLNERVDKKRQHRFKEDGIAANNRQNN